MHIICNSIITLRKLAVDMGINHKMQASVLLDLAAIG